MALIDRAHAAANGIAVEVEDFSRILSSQLSVEDVYQLAVHVRDRLKSRQDLSGVVVTHGTGTMEESAFMASLVVADPRPIVFTGAMNAADDALSDGPSNLAVSIRVAVDRRSRRRGVLIVIANRIFDSLDATKQHTTDLASFHSVNYGPIGYAYPDRIQFGRRVETRLRLPVTVPDFKVDLIKFVVGMDDRFVRTSIDAGSSGIVLEASGLGNVNDAVARALAAAIKAGITVVIASRVPAGRVYPAYGTRGGGRSLATAGCILSSIPGPKARLLLMLALGAHLDKPRLRRLFDP
jgi:L-asparaginase